MECAVKRFCPMHKNPRVLSPLYQMKFPSIHNLFGVLPCFYLPKRPRMKIPCVVQCRALGWWWRPTGEKRLLMRLHSLPVSFDRIGKFRLRIFSAFNRALFKCHRFAHSCFNNRLLATLFRADSDQTSLPNGAMRQKFI